MIAMTLVRKTLVWILPVLSSVLMFVSCSAHKKAQRYSYLLENKPVGASPASPSAPAASASSGTAARPTTTPARPVRPAASATEGERARPSDIVAVSNRPASSSRPTPAAAAVKPAPAARNLDSELPAVAPLNASKAAKAEIIVSEAIRFMGTRYKRGGTTTRGIDCSGLCLVAYQAVGISIPHWSTAIASTIPTKVRMSDIQPGDILCFNDHSRDGRIDHVGLVTEVSNGIVTFIHATSHGGVMTSQLSDSHWQRRYRLAVRPLDGVANGATQRLEGQEIGD